jgi:anti-sigma B factor antagonist
MEIGVVSKEGVTVVRINGEIDGKTAPAAQDKVLELASENNKILLELSGVEYMSSAGLRMLLMLYRKLTGQDRQLILAGVPEMLQDIMSHTGFLKFFILVDTVEDGIAALQQPPLPLG